MPTITKTESLRRKRANAKMFPEGLIDAHNEAGLPCECCKEPKTAGTCFEDDDHAHVCNRCWWLRTDRLPGKTRCR
jgi:hypothetical protein